jgi:hypothetical protein
MNKSGDFAQAAQQSVNLKTLGFRLPQELDNHLEREFELDQSL